MIGVEMNAKTDKLLMDLYVKYDKFDVTDFVNHCKETIKNAKVPNFDILNYLKTCNNKDVALTKTSNFLMKGVGFSVIKT